MGRNNIVFIVIGAVAFSIGISLKLFVGRRRFYRRNQAGLEQFKNYRGALLIPFVESILTLIGGLFIIIGCLCLSVTMFVG